jgi:hypothetical protein
MKKALLISVALLLFYISFAHKDDLLSAENLPNAGESPAAQESWTTSGIGTASVLLPVKFGPLCASQRTRIILLSWTSYTETNVDHYEIERSANGQSFETIDNVSAAGNSKSRIDYNWSDVSALDGENFYRVKSVDIDGKATYSIIVKVFFGVKDSSSVSVYPNPVKGSQIAVGFSNMEKGNYSVSILNGNGQEMNHSFINVVSDNVTQSIQLPSTLKPGMYYLQLNGISSKLMKPFVVQ